GALLGLHAGPRVGADDVPAADLVAVLRLRLADLEAEPGELRRRVALRHVHDAVGDRDLLGLVAARAHHPADEGRAADEQDREAHPERGLLPGAAALG